MLTVQRLKDNCILEQLPVCQRLKDFDVRLYIHAYCKPLATVREYADTFGVTYETTRRSVKRLVDAGWAYKVKPTDGRRGRVIVPWMPPEVESQVVALLAQVRTEVRFYGEWLMKCVLDVLVDDRDFHDNAGPQWLVNPDTARRLELDRWYRNANVALEFQGKQHTRTGDRYVTTDDELAQRMHYDEMKRQICARHRIKLIEIHPTELDFDTIRARISDKLPLFPLPEQSPLLRELHGMCHSHVLRNT